jgi:hypothetical protein
MTISRRYRTQQTPDGTLKTELVEHIFSTTFTEPLQLPAPAVKEGPGFFTYFGWSFLVTLALLALAAVL